MTFPGEDRMRFIIEEARTNEIICRDLVVEKPKILKKLSGPSIIEFDVDWRDPSARGIVFKPWGHWCHVEKMINGRPKIIASGIFQPSDLDPETGKLHAKFEGFSGYPKGIPWLENWNPIAVDPFEIVDRIWKHLQSFENGDLGVTVYNLDIDGESKITPPDSGTQLLPGLSLQNAASADFILEFFAIFIREIDFIDCGDYINKLARDIPFDYFEEAEWNENKTAINKYLQLAYPHGGTLQTNLSFRFGENVLRGKPKIESEIQWTSDVAIRGWAPNRVYSSTLSNADPERYRRVILEEDAHINSIERSEAWAHRQLTRRQHPNYWESIIIDMNHPNARFGTWEVGDQIRVQGVMPWVGEVDQVHKIIAYSVDEETATCELTLRAEGAFTYDPIFFEGANPNLIENSYFTENLDGWFQEDGLWTRDPIMGSTNLGSAKVTASGAKKELITEEFIDVSQGDIVTATCAVAWANADSLATSSPIWLSALAYRADDSEYGQPIFDSIVNPTGNSRSWQSLSGNWLVPPGVDKIKVQLIVRPEMLTGDVWFDDVVVSKDD